MPKKTKTTQNIASDINAKAAWRINKIEILDDYQFKVVFNDGTCGIVDMKNFIHDANAGVFSELKNIQLFNKAYIEFGTICWPNGLDLAPDVIHKELQDKELYTIPA